MICGLPGAGKSTLAKRMESERNAIRFCPDEWIEPILANPLDVQERDRLRDPIENLQWELAQTYLQKGLTVILENGFWAEEERSLYAMGALELGAKIELYYLQISDDLQRMRIESRNQNLVSPTFVMTFDEICHGRSVFQPPSVGELAFYDAWEVIVQG